MLSWKDDTLPPQFFIPGGLLMVLTFVSGADFSMPGFMVFFPLLVPMAIFYWVLYWPALMPAWLIFVAGVIQDALYGYPIGASGLANLIMLSIALGSRRWIVNMPFIVSWIIFSVAVLIYLLVVALSWRYYTGTFHLGSMLWLQWVFSVLFFPIMQRVFYFIHKRYLNLPG